jgi:transposase
MFVLDTGCRWRDLPEELGCGSRHTAWRRLRAGQDAGVWDRLHQLVLVFSFVPRCQGLCGSAK